MTPKALVTTDTLTLAHMTTVALSPSLRLTLRVRGDLDIRFAHRITATLIRSLNDLRLLPLRPPLLRLLNPSRTHVTLVARTIASTIANIITMTAITITKPIYSHDEHKSYCSHRDAMFCDGSCENYSYDFDSSTAPTTVTPSPITPKPTHDPTHTPTPSHPAHVSTPSPTPNSSSHFNIYS